MLEGREWADEIGDNLAILGGETADARRARRQLAAKRERCRAR